MVTGDSLPVSKKPGSDLIGASINKNGTLRARAVRVGADTALAQIVKLVQEAQNSKAPAQALADRAAFWLVLVALIGGALTFTVWLLVGRSVPVATPLAWRRPPRSWWGPASAPSAASSSRMRWRWRRPRACRRWCWIRPAR